MVTAAELTRRIQYWSSLQAQEWLKQGNVVENVVDLSQDFLSIVTHSQDEFVDPVSNPEKWILRMLCSSSEDTCLNAGKLFPAFFWEYYTPFLTPRFEISKDEVTCWDIPKEMRREF
jgi:hypothetical protein